MTAATGTPDNVAQKSRAFWLKQLHQWHWVSAALCLAGMVLFSITGFTLNHASLIGAAPEVTTTTTELPPDLLSGVRRASDESPAAGTPLPHDVAGWLNDRLAADVSRGQVEWSPEEIYVSLPRPGGDAWLTIDLDSGVVTHELTDRGWLSYLNDLHKGRHAGPAWSLFIDLFAFAALLFATTGLLLLKMHSNHRPGTWPMVGLGLVLPLLLAILFIH